MDRQPAYRECIVCGSDNPVGLKARYYPSGKGVATQVTPPEHFRGFGGVLHGGIVTAILDDCMWYAIYRDGGHVTMTAEISVRWRRQAPMGETLHAYAEVSGQKMGLFFTKARLTSAGGEVLAEATGKFAPAPPEVAAGFRVELAEPPTG